MSFESILQSIQDTTDRDAMTSMAQKYPSLRRFTEAGEQAIALETELGTRGYKSLPDAARQLNDYDSFYNTWWDRDAKMWKNEARLQGLVDSLQTQVMELQNRSETEMTPEEIKAVVAATMTEMGVEPSKTLIEKVTTMVREEIPKAVNPFATRMQRVFTQLTPKVIEHKERFGEPIDYDAVMQYMQDEYARNGGVPVDPEVAYRAVYKDKIAAKDQSMREDEIKAAREEGALAERKKIAEQRGSSMPVDDGRSVATGALRRRLSERRKEDAGGNDKLGSGAAAAAAAQEKRMRDAAA